MRYFEKKLIEQRLPLFQEWEKENQEAILAWMGNPAKTGDMLWTELGKTFGIERATKIDPVLLRVAAYLKLPVSVIKENPKNATILKRPLIKGDKIYVPNPPHCDDAKSAFDAKKEHTIIINPSEDKALIEKLIFKDNGEISYQNRETVKNDIIENTFTVLGLNCSTLVERRQEKWLDSYINYRGEDGILIDIEDRDTLLSIINKLIEGKSQPNDEGLLEAFYFVEIALLKSFLNGY